VSLFLDAASGQDTPRAPIWVMRQAGRYLPEYRALKEKYTFWEMCRTPELAAQVTLQPLKRFPLDAAILFQDIMTPLPPMGLEIDFDPGPVFARPIRSAAQVEALCVPEQDEIAPYVAPAIRLIRGETTTPLIGFGGAPLTLAAYCVQGGGSKDFAEFRGFLRQEPQAAHALLEKLTQVSIRYLTMQAQAGAQAVQLFDSWAGLHDAPTYREFAAPYNARVLHALEGVPRIYLAVEALHLYDEIAKLPAEVVSVDWRTPLSRVRRFFPGKTLQGNLDPAALLGPRDALLAAAEDVLREGLGGPHIFNLGHGIFRQTDPDQLAALVDAVHAFERVQPSTLSPQPSGASDR
jgi:uroporphyrinogen decarboxylase